MLMHHCGTKRHNKNLRVRAQAHKGKYIHHMQAAVHSVSFPDVPQAHCIEGTSVTIVQVVLHCSLGVEWLTVTLQ